MIWTTEKFVVLFYFENTDGGVQQLWASDGTAAGTRLVTILSAPLDDSSTGFVDHSSTTIGGTLYYATNDITDGYELWRSDGTAAGTVMVKAFLPASSLSDLISVNGALYFEANDGVHGTELWKTDGTAAGTVMVKDIWPGPGKSLPANLTNVNGTLYFSANDGTDGVELWKSDGTAAGNGDGQEHRSRLGQL